MSGPIKIPQEARHALMQLCNDQLKLAGLLHRHLEDRPAARDELTALVGRMGSQIRQTKELVDALTLDALFADDALDFFIYVLRDQTGGTLQADKAACLLEALRRQYSAAHDGLRQILCGD